MKKNAALQIIALALAFILVAGVIVGVIFWQNGNISFTPFGQEQTKTPDEEADVSGSSLIETTISNNELSKLLFQIMSIYPLLEVRRLLRRTQIPSALN